METKTKLLQKLADKDSLYGLDRGFSRWCQKLANPDVMV